MRIKRQEVTLKRKARFTLMDLKQGELAVITDTTREYERVVVIKSKDGYIQILGDSNGWSSNPDLECRLLQKGDLIEIS